MKQLIKNFDDQKSTLVFCQSKVQCELMATSLALSVRQSKIT